MSKQRMVVEWSPHDTSLFAVGADNLRLFETTAGGDVDGAGAAAAAASLTTPSATTQRKRSFRLVKINAQVAQLKCMEWHPHAAKPLLIAAGMGSGKVVLSDFQDPRARAVREYVPKYSRPCNAVAWNRALPQHLAAGFDKVRSDFCALVWDLNASSGAASSTISGGGAAGSDAMLGDADSVDGLSGSMLLLGTSASSSASRKAAPASSGGGGFTRENDKPVHELSNSEATVALSWVPSQPLCLATGTGFKWLRVYDLRAKGAAPLSVVAHSKAVLGVVFDQHRPHMLATYTDGHPQEAVRVWDIRRLDASAGPVLSLHQSSKSLSQVAWCPSKPGILVTTSAEEKWISLWDVTKPESDGSTVLKKPFRRRYTADPLVSFSWQYVPTVPLTQQQQQQPQQHQQLPPHSGASLRGDMAGVASANALKDITAAAFPNRLLTVSLNGEIEDISVHDSMPISVSSHGSIVFSCGKLLFGGSATHRAAGQGTAAAARQVLEGARDSAGDDARAHDLMNDISTDMFTLAKQGYSVDLSTNLKLFAGAADARHRQLHRLWAWVDQAEVLRRARANRVAHMRALAAGGGGAAAGGNPVGAFAPGPLRGWPFNANVLVIVGIRNLLAVPGDSPTAHNVEAILNSSADDGSLANITSAMKTDPVLNCPVFEGLGRRLALLACNWDPDNGQASLRGGGGTTNAPAAFHSPFMLADNLPPPTRGHVALHRSNSGAWASQKQFEESHGFGNRSDDESGRHELRAILAKCESDGDFTRAAALAVFHGDLNAAVSLLQKGALWLSQLQSVNAQPATPHTPDVLQLVAMAVAGYSGAATNPSGQSLWATMCQQLLRRDEILSTRHPRYLHALLAFLCTASAAASGSGSGNAARQPQPQPQPQPLPRRTGNNSVRRSWGSVDGLSVLTSGFRPSGVGQYAAILGDPTLALSDRVAFACRYLSADDLRAFVAQHEDECEQVGRLEGLILSGLNAAGIRILQAYLDATGDIQTLALLAARLPSSFVEQTPPLGNWVVIYQDLLNQWQLFHERARLDVGRSRLDDVLNGFANFARDPDAEELHAELAAPSSLSVPPQLYVRCNFCNAALSLSNLLRQGGSHSSWLNRAKPKLTCCPSCRKPLPQCALCLLPFGSLNPYFELAHRRSKLLADAVTSAVGASSAADAGMVLEEPSGSKLENENLAQLSSIPFVEWFTWCQACKHGGHAHHLAEWFATHSACPVTDCNCNCQHLDLPIMLNKRQTEILARQQQQAQDEEDAATAAAAAVAAAAAQAMQRAASGHGKKHHHGESGPGLPKRASVKHGSLVGTPHLQPMGASGMSASASFRMLPPSRATLGYQSKLSSSVASNLNALGGGGGGSSAGGGLAGNGSAGAGGDMSLGTRLDQLEKDKSGAYKFM
ncbi:hypothetical protein PybrP1_006619 [[Pythium] brassicae (nom. inval.)]|nr:hypothetical protein PybrP1_006619 [[Pythium] brassicae (nom. inval.)]